MRKLVRYLKDYKLESVLGPLFKMLEASFELMWESRIRMLPTF